MSATCRSCGAQIIWAQTASGRKMPVDAEAVLGGNLSLVDVPGEAPLATVIEASADVFARRPHFATCPDAASWRHNRKEQSE